MRWLRARLSAATHTRHASSLFTNASDCFIVMQPTPVYLLFFSWKMFQLFAEQLAEQLAEQQAKKESRYL